jgi:hypothetical protein
VVEPSRSMSTLVANTRAISRNVRLAFIISASIAPLLRSTTHPLRQWVHLLLRRSSPSPLLHRHQSSLPPFLATEARAAHSHRPVPALPLRARVRLVALSPHQLPLLLPLHRAMGAMVRVARLSRRHQYRPSPQKPRTLHCHLSQTALSLFRRRMRRPRSHPLAMEVAL